MASFTHCWPTFLPRPPPCFSEISILINPLPSTSSPLLLFGSYGSNSEICDTYGAKRTSPFCSGQVLGGGVGEEAVVFSDLLPLCGPTLPLVLPDRGKKKSTCLCNIMSRSMEYCVANIHDCVTNTYFTLSA